MLLWIVVILVLSLIAFIWIKLEHQARIIKFVIMAAIVLLLGISMVMLFNSGEVDLSTPQGIISAIYLYVGWLGGFVVDMWDLGVTTTGKVVSALNVSDSV